MNLSGRVALVTGATQAMGAAIAERLAADGAAIVGVGRTAERGEAIASALRERGYRAAFCRADVSDEAQVAAAVEFAIAQYGRLDILVNNAASFDAETAESSVVDEPSSVFEQVLRVGLFGPFWMAKYAIPVMIDRGEGGSLVNISSYASTRGVLGIPAYSASKGGLESLTRQLAAEYAGQGIRSNALLLGSISVPRNASLHQDPEWSKRSRAGRLIQRAGTPDDVANVVAFLASDESAFVTGAVIPVDGGLLVTAPSSGLAPRADLRH